MNLEFNSAVFLRMIYVKSKILRLDFCIAFFLDFKNSTLFSVETKFLNYLIKPCFFTNSKRKNNS